MKKILHTLIAAGFLIVAPLLALAQNESTQAETASEVNHISGGVGAEGMAEINAVQSNYNFKALFVRGPRGEYLAIVTVKITDPNGKVVLETTTSGPVLMAQLEKGQYRIEATTTTDAKTITKNVNIRGKFTEVSFRFPPEE